MAPFFLPKGVAAAVIQLLLIAPWSGIDATKTPAIFTRSRRGGSSVDDSNFRSSNNKDRHQKRNLVRGQAWVAQELRAGSTDNIFVRNDPATTDECACDRRRRRLGIGQSSCTCDDNDERVTTTPPTESPVSSGVEKGVSYFLYGKGSKSSSFYGKGGGSTSRSSSSDEGGVGGGNSNSSSSSDESYYSSYDSKKTNKGKGTAYYGKGGDSESYYYYRYTKKSKDSKSSKKGKSKDHGKGFSYDDDYVYPTLEPTKAPSTPLPTPSNIQPTAVEPTIKPTMNSSDKPTSNKDGCSVSSLGLYGQNNGLSTEFRFLYQTQVIRSVMVPELDLDIIPKVEVDMGNKLLPKLFPDDCSALGEVITRSGGNRKVIDDAPPQRTRHLQQQFIPLTGMSIKPRDTVDESAKCKGVESNNFSSCYVLEGRIVVFFKNEVSVTDRFKVETAIQQTILNGGLTEADNRLLGVSFLQFIKNPPTPPPTQSPTEEPGNWISDVAWWILLLISLGILAVLVMMLVVCSFFCKRCRNNQRRPNSQQPPRPNAATVPVQNANTSDNVNTFFNTNANANVNGDDSSSSSSNSSSNNSNNISGGGVVGSNSSIATSENLSVDIGGVSKGSLNDPTNSEYHHHSDDHINQSLVPTIEEPIEEEQLGDFSSGDINNDTLQQASSRSNNKENDPLYMPVHDNQYNGVSYEDQIYQNNNTDVMVAYDPNPNQYQDESASQPSKSDSLDRTKNGSQRRVTYDESSKSRSRSLSRKDQQFRELGEDIVSPKSNNSGPENYSSDIYSATSRQTSYQSEEVVEEDDEDESTYEDVEEEYEIEYASQSERLGDDAMEQSENLYEEVWVDENDPAFGNSNINSSNSNINSSNSNINSSHSNSNTNPTSTSYSSSNSNTNSSNTSSSKTTTSYSGSHSSNLKEDRTPLPFLAHNAQLQQQTHRTSFDSLRNKWEQP